ncbi:hypothetical protein J2Z69_002216 [Paenibacillus shirakamiensis]|uniref:Uncharacterized protein n=1 Tax=Paenibacillus shirakamiensis TaxID=1265935 RepID=A0ABS4JHI6_9BACL|nr:single-stranded DNA-binding protein [Paenibacillus shirakamiensis]MBP2001173.1 hypothetical protein [Paenibacillus shirakamiensis]
MGEEKPDEELMGKRKSSPRLSTTFGDVDIFSLSVRVSFIPRIHKKGNSEECIFQSNPECGTISS